MSELRNMTLVFLIKRSGKEVSHICLAMKKRGFGAGKLNGVGGKVEAGETIEEAAAREAHEEIGVVTHDLRKVAELTFHFQHNPSWDQVVHAYLCESWENEPTESEEMHPAWYKVADIPFEKMWPDDKFWVPQVLEGLYLKATFTLGENDTILKQQVDIAEKL